MTSVTAGPPAGPPLRAVAYIRVSRARDGMVSPELQQRAIQQYCRRRGYAITCTLEDLDRSGRFWKRRQVEQAVTLIERGRADVLVVWRWSRVTRNRLDWALAVDRVEGAGGRLESATEPFDATTSSGRLARGMLAELAAFESDRIADGYREALERRVSRGLPSNGQGQLGYRKHEDGHYSRDRRTGPLVAEAYRRYIDGASFRALARWLSAQGVRSPAARSRNEDILRVTIQRALDSGFAAGYIRHLGELLPGKHEPLIDEDTWQAYLALRGATRRQPRPVGDDFLLANMAWCSCGSQMVCIRQREPSYFRYRCPVHPKGGGGESVLRHRLEELVERWLAALVADPTVRATAQADAQKLARCRSEEARELRQQLTTAAPSARSGLRAALTATRHDGLRPTPAQLAGALREDWVALDVPERRRRLMALTERIVLHNDPSHPVIDIHASWGSVMTYDGVPEPRTSTGEALVLPDRSAEARLADPARLLTPTEAARLAGVQPATLRNWDRQGLMPHTQCTADGYGRLYDLQDIRSRRPRERPPNGQRPQQRRG